MSLTLYNGDCLDVMKTIPDASVDLIICDLPYGCLTGGGITKKETAEKYGRKGTEGISGCAWDVKIDLAAFWEQVRRIRKSDDSPTIHFATTKFGHDLICSNEKEFRYDLVWNKQRGVSFLSANKMPMRSHEMIYIFSKAGAYYNRVDISGDFPAWKKEPNSIRKGQVYTNEIKRTTSSGEAGKRCPLSVIDIKQKASYQMKGGHPTEKPVELYKFLIERYSPKGGTVLDPTFGSGNSGAATEALGRHYIGIEKDPGFFEKAAKNLGAE
jgi:site-specific DNA-methyltransferase (adenine-specific)